MILDLMNLLKYLCCYIIWTKRKITMQDINGVNVKKFSDKFVIDENVNIILDELPDEWIESSFLGANKLYEKFKKW